MAIGMIEMQGQIPRVQDYTAFKHQDDMKSIVDQSNLSGQNEKKIDEQANYVVKKENASKSNNQSDAKDQGRNQYAGDGGKNRRKDVIPAEGRVIVKGKSHFDISI